MKLKVAFSWFFASFASLALASSLIPAPGTSHGVTRAISSQGDDTPASVTYSHGNLVFDLSYLRDPDLQRRVYEALIFGFQVAARKPHGRLAQEIADLQGNGELRQISFYSDPADIGLTMPGAAAFATWEDPAYGTNGFGSSPSLRTNLAIVIPPLQTDYPYLMQTVWHELLHLTLNVTHRQYGRADDHADNSVWYPTIKKIMLDFPRVARDPVTGEKVELYNPERSPWS